MEHRPELDGLRAIAVIPVILFHAGVEQISGGYVGVDVFFVISGFLITGILIRELDAGQFSLVGFYERRARRILPALFVVLFVTAFVAPFVMLPYELEALGRGILAVVFFLSNVLFWREDGYFAATSELNPLLHTWSLAVEEQYYILFPLMLWVGWRLFPKSVVPLLGIIAVGSLASAEFLSTRMPSANFFLLPTRAWELLTGSLTAFFVYRRGAPRGVKAEAVGAAGLSAIGFAVFTYDSATPFPSLFALVPVLGTVAIIVAASPLTYVGKLLSSSPLVGIGLISYSAYLWHQPMFAYARLLHADQHPNQSLMLLLVVFTLTLAWLSWRFVEQPLRRKSVFSREIIFVLSGLATVTFVVISTIAIATDGLLQRYPEKYRPWVSTGPLEYGDFVQGAYQSVHGAPLSKDKPNMVLVGDSFSQDFYNVIQAAGAFEDYAISAIYVPRVCQVHFGVPEEEYLSLIDPVHRDMCQKRVLRDEDVIIMQAADVVVIAARYQPWSAALLHESIAAMSLPGKVIVVGSKSFEENRRALLALDPDQLDAARKAPDAWSLESSNLLARNLSKGQFVNLLEMMCVDGCPLFTSEGALISYDGRHLTPSGAAYVAGFAFEKGPLAPFVADRTETAEKASFPPRSQNH